MRSSAREELAFFLLFRYHVRYWTPPDPNLCAALEINKIQFQMNPTLSVLAALLLATLAGCRSPQPVTAANDHHTNRSGNIEERYRQAELQLSWNLNERFYHLSGQPNWLDDDTFWYRVETPDGIRFRFVDPATGERSPAFDHERLAGAISERAGVDLTEGQLPFYHFRYIDKRTAVRFRFQSRIWICNIETYRCSEPADPPVSLPASVDSPDGRYAAFIREHDLWVLDREEDEQIRLTEDGTADYGYATDSQGWTRSDRPILKWSPDSRRIATFRQDEREVGRMPLIRTEEGRPALETWPYALPGDSAVPMLERVVIDVKERRLVRLDLEASHQRTSNCCGLTRQGRWADIEWSPDGETLAFVTTSRDYARVTLYLADPVSGQVRQVYSELDEPFFESNLTSRGLPNWRVLHGSDEFVWFSRADGWGHLYLHDLKTGERINRITSGEWNVMDLLRIDPEERSILITAVGREEGVDPYFAHLYRVGLDDRTVRRLTRREANYQVSISPSGRYFTANWSRPDIAPVFYLQDRDGRELMELERADLSRLTEGGFRIPEPVTVKARDGVTRLHGLLIKPSDFDPDRRYPIINSIYPGPQIGSVGSRSFTTVRRGQAHALAELGFVVLLLDGLGTPHRSKEFHTYWYGDMSDNGLEDQVTAMRQLADRYEWIDLERAGIYGHSGGGYATVAAMLRFPDFFRVGVAGAGNLDNRSYTYYWGEKYQGPLLPKIDGDSYSNQSLHRMADRLKGKLLISYGTMDSNVHPNMTLRLIESLIHHNRDFDLMVFPNRGHGYANEPYNLRITWDYFVRHLLEIEPPGEFEFSAGR